MWEGCGLAVCSPFDPAPGTLLLVHLSYHPSQGNDNSWRTPVQPTSACPSLYQLVQGSVFLQE